MLNAFSIILRKTNKELEFVQQALSDPSLYPLSISLLRGPYILPGALWPGAVPGAESKANHSLPSATVLRSTTNANISSLSLTLSTFSHECLNIKAMECHYYSYYYFHYYWHQQSHSDLGLRREPDLTSPPRKTQEFQGHPDPRSMFQNYTFTN